jgi:hypothetical protein
MRGSVRSPAVRRKNARSKVLRSLFLLLFAPLGVAAAQNRTIAVHFASGDSIVTRDWFFEYVCLTPLQGNPNLAAKRTDRSQSLRLRADSSERVIPQRALDAIQFEWSTSPAGRPMRSQAHILVDRGAVIREWQPAERSCQDVNLTLPPTQTRAEWLRITLSGTVAYAVPAPDAERPTEIRFRSFPEARPR